MSTGNAELDALLAFVPDDFADPEADYQQVRATMAPFHGYALTAAVECEYAHIAGVSCALIRPASSRPSRRVLHCHGGAFVSCPLDDYLFYGEMIALETQAEVILPDYRLAPEHLYPAAHDDCYAVLRALVTDGGAPPVLMGESCGGILALAAMCRARDESLTQPLCFVSLTAWLDLSCAHWQHKAEDKFLHPKWLHHRAAEYCFGRKSISEQEAQLLDNPALSPVRADLKGLAPMYFQVAEHDHFADSAYALAERAEIDGVSLKLEQWPAMVHGWHGLLGAGLAEAAQAWENIRRYIETMEAELVSNPRA